MMDLCMGKVQWFFQVVEAVHFYNALITIVCAQYIDNVEESKAHKDGITVVSSSANQAALAESEWGLVQI